MQDALDHKIAEYAFLNSTLVLYGNETRVRATEFMLKNKMFSREYIGESLEMDDAELSKLLESYTKFNFVRELPGKLYDASFLEGTANLLGYKNPMEVCNLVGGCEHLQAFMKKRNIS